MPSKSFFIKLYHLSPNGFIISITTVLSFLFFIWGINSWKFAFVGDEWPFYIYAHNIAISSLYPNPFSFNGVYNTHSQLASIYQSIFMTIFGPSNFSWRLSNCILIFPISFFFYRYIRNSFNSVLAVTATIILQSSYYLANFFKIGYDNPQCFALFIVCLYLVNRFSENPTKKTGGILGLALGISFYIYMGPIFPLFLWPYFLPLLKSIRSKGVVKALFSLVLVYLITLVPIITNISSLWPVIRAFGVLQNFHFNNAILRSFTLFYINNDYYYNHFVKGSYLDVISGFFCLIGTLVAFFRMKNKSYLYLVLSYLTTTIIIAVSSPGWFSPTTRGIFLLPYGFIFSGIGLTFVIKKIKNDTLSFTFFWYVIFAIISLNVYQSQIGVFTNNKLNNSGFTGIALLVRSFQQAKVKNNSIIIVVSPTQSITKVFWQFPSILNAYRLDTLHYTIVSPVNFVCPMKNTNILYFRQDTIAVNTVENSTCIINNTVNYTELSPSITFY